MEEDVFTILLFLRRSDFDTKMMSPTQVGLDGKPIGRFLHHSPLLKEVPSLTPK
jgi:hypothetical protein